MSWNIPGHPNSDFSQLIINHFKVLIIPKDVDNGTIFLLRRNKGEINIFKSDLNIPGHPNSDFSQLIINHFKVLIIPKDVDNGTIFLLRRNKGEINIFK